MSSGALGSADLSSSSSVLVLSLKTDVDKVFIDTSFGYEWVDLNTLIFVEKEKGLYSLTYVITYIWWHIYLSRVCGFSGKCVIYAL